MNVTIKSSEEQEKMRIAGRLAAEVLDMIGDFVQPGISTNELDQICHKFDLFIIFIFVFVCSLFVQFILAHFRTFSFLYNFFNI